MGAVATPKLGSKALHELVQHLRAMLDAPAFVVLLYSALDRNRLEAIYNRFAPKDAPRSRSLEKEQLVGGIAGWFFGALAVAHAVIRELDRACSKERHIVASLPDGKIEERLQSYQALDFRRERAKLAWALLRDNRPEAHSVTAMIISEMMADAQGLMPGVDHRELPGAVNQENERERILQERVESYEALVSEVRGHVRGLEGRLAQLERERAELMVSVGRKENALRAEERMRREAELALAQTERRTRTLEQQMLLAEQDSMEKLVQERDQLAQKIRRLEKVHSIGPKLKDLLDANAELEQQLEQARSREISSKKQQQELLHKLTLRDRSTQERVSRLRDALKTARKMAQQPEQHQQHQPLRETERVGVFVDAANLSASAARDFGRYFDFASLLDYVGDRQCVQCVAYVVDNGQEGFGRFAAALRAMGFSVKVKKPSERPDGSVKADWDMGLAMDIIEAWPKLDTILLASGDGDFVPLVRRLKKWRRRVEVAAFDSATHPELKRTADAFWALASRATT